MKNAEPTQVVFESDREPNKNKQDNNTIDAEIIDDVEIIEEKKDKNEL